MSNRILLSTKKGLFVLGKKGGRWKLRGKAFLGQDVTIALHDRQRDVVFAALHHGHFGCKLQRSLDGGETFEEVASPKYPDKPAGVEDKDPFRGTEVPWSVQLLWSLEAGGDGRLWCGTIPGGLFTSDDGGDSWQMCRALWDDPRRREWTGGGYDHPGIHSICIDPRDPKHVMVAVSTGGVWETADCGRSWTLRGEGMVAEYMPPERSRDPLAQDVHRLVCCQQSPDVFWVQHHNGVFRSADGAHTFTEVTSCQPSKFGFAVAVDPTDADVAWFVPAVKDECRIPVDGALVVARTKNGGKSFQVLTDGLPQRDCYSLVYRHGLDVDERGKRLVLGSTTGEVFLSEDRGKSWERLRADLPPVHAVRFV
jgi:photosystem II stability/assembly factor-like uncharacterized protein